jgi:hypothetical protein
MPIIAEFVDGHRRYKPELRRTSRGWTARRWYRVPTSDVRQAHAAIGLPARGDIYDASLPTLRVVEVGDAEDLAGQPGAPGEAGGWSFICVDYAENIEVLQIPQQPGDKWTEFDVSYETVNVRYGYKPDLLALNPDWDRQIANGDGVGKEIPRVTALVRKFYAKTFAFDYAFLDELTRVQPLNRFTIVVPGLYVGDVQTRSYGERTVRYRGYRTRISGDLLEVAHELVIGDHRAYYYRQDKDGLASPSGGLSAVYINDFEHYDFAAVVA